MTAYLIFEELTADDPDAQQRGEYDTMEAYKLIGHADEGDAQAAIRAVAAEAVAEGQEGRRFWATPQRSWRGLEVKTKVVVDATPLTLMSFGDEPPAEAEEPKPELVEDVSL